MSEEHLLQSERLFNRLIRECKDTTSGRSLSYSLRKKLKEMNAIERREFVCRVEDNCVPLCIASRYGNAKIVKYLIDVCYADIEQKGLCQGTAHYATPLWWATFFGNFDAVQCLVELGANINTVSDSGSTPLKIASSTLRLCIVKYLIGHGADINKTDYDSSTCLMSAVKCVETSSFLIKHGASVSALDVENKTALHYAVLQNMIQTVILLLNRGADPFARNRYNDDALQVACLHGNSEIFHYLIKRIEYSPERLADAHELLGSTLCYNNLQGLTYWRRGIQIRSKHGQNGTSLLKQPVMPSHQAFKWAKEFTTIEELRAVENDEDSIKIQCMLINERVLGPHHVVALQRLTRQCIAFNAFLGNEDCFNYGLRALEIVVKRDSVLSSTTVYVARVLMQLLYKLRFDTGSAFRPRFQHFLTIFTTLSDNISYYQQSLNVRPINEKQQHCFNYVIKCFSVLLLYMVSEAQNEEETGLVISSVKSLLKQNAYFTTYGNNMLHEGIIDFFNDIHNSSRIDVFMDTIKMLLDCGMPVNATNVNHVTPLHVAVVEQCLFYPPLVELLLDYGAHIDIPDEHGLTPLHLIVNNSSSEIRLGKYLSLKCLAATTIEKYKIPYVGILPAVLEEFVRLHEPKPKFK